jgi:hypothetical protein
MMMMECVLENGDDVIDLDFYKHAKGNNVNSNSVQLKAKSISDKLKTTGVRLGQKWIRAQV